MMAEQEVEGKGKAVLMIRRLSKLVEKGRLKGLAKHSGNLLENRIGTF